MQEEDTQQLQTNACSPTLLSSPASEMETFQILVVRSEAVV